MSLLVPMITRGALGRNDLMNNYGTANNIRPPINDFGSLMMGGGMNPMGGMGAAGSMMGAGMGVPGINSSSVGGFVTGAAVGAVAMSAMQNGGMNTIDHPNGTMPNNGYNNNHPQNNFTNNGYNNNQPQNNFPNNSYNNNQAQNNFPNNGYNNNQPQNNFPNNGYNNNQPQNNFPNNGYNNNQPQNNFPNNGYNNNQPQGNFPNNNNYQPVRESDALDALFTQQNNNPPQNSYPGNNPQQNNVMPAQNNVQPQRSAPNAGQTNFGVQQPVSSAPASYASDPAQSHPVIKRNRVEPTGDRLSKGQKYSIKDRDGRPVSQLKICLGWDVKDGRCELDASAFMLGDNGKVPGDEWFIFYGQPDSPDNGVHYKVYKEDPNSPDDAAIVLDLDRVDGRVSKIALAVTIYEPGRYSLNFGMVKDLYARILDSRTNREIASFKMDECYSSVTAMVLGELYRYKGEWKFNAVGSGVNKELAEFCGMYGVALE